MKNSLGSLSQAHGESFISERNRQTTGNFGGSKTEILYPVHPLCQQKVLTLPVLSPLPPGSTTGNSKEPPAKFSRIANTAACCIVHDDDDPLPVFNLEGEKLPLPLDSCCSVSLVSRSHADLVASKRPQLKYQSLEKPVAVSVADAKAQLQAVGTMEIPIQWNNGKETTFQMLVVPGLSCPILFGENHLHSSQALVDHADPSIHFRHPSMSFKITCSLQNPLPEASHRGSNTHADVTCLLTGAPVPGHSPGPSKLNRGLNFVSVYLTLGTSLLSLSHSNLWVHGQEIKPGVRVLSGPFHLSATTDQLLPDVSCHASVCDFTSSSSDTITEHVISDFQPLYTTTLAVECKRKQTDIPQNVILGHLRPIQDEDLQGYEDAAENTANILSESWMWTNGQQALTPTAVPHPTATSISSSQTYKMPEQQKELAAAGLDSSVLSPFTENLSEFNEHDNEFVPSTATPLEPFSEEYHQALIKALALDSSKYAHVDQPILHEFEQLLHKYPTALLLSGSLLGEIHGFEHHIETDGDPCADIRPDTEQEQPLQNATPSLQEHNVVRPQSFASSPDLNKVALSFGQYLSSLSKPQCYASEACKAVYQCLPDARDILNRHGKLKGLVTKCPFLSLKGGPHGGTYLLVLDVKLFQELNK